MAGGTIEKGVELALVRPGPDGLAWLDAAVADLKGGDPLRPVTVLAPNELAGRQIRWHLCHRGGYANVHTPRLTSAALEIARPARLAGVPLLDPVIEESAVRASVAEHAAAFRGVDHPSLHAALVELFRLLRRLEPDPAVLAAAATTPTALAALAAHRSFRTRTEPYYDPTLLTTVAAQRLTAARAVPPELDRLGALVLYMPTRFDPADARFLAAAARWVPLRAAFAHFGDPEGLGDRPGQDAAALLAGALGVPPPAPPPPRPLFPAVRVIRTPDPHEEVREALRAVAADLAAGVPLHRIALLYRQTDPYAPLVRDALTAAELPWASSEGRRLHESRPGRALLGLLRLDERRFAREALMEWLETEPFFDADVRALGPALWNRLSRQANVVRGADQWRDRLGALAVELDTDADRRAADGLDPAVVEAPRAHARAATAIAGFVDALHAALRPPRGATTWAACVAWAERLAARFVGPPEAWPAAEQPYARALLAALADMRRVDALGGAAPTPEAFVAVLAAALEARSLPVGQFGVGVFVGPVTAVTGLTFDRVHLLGLVEGAFPPAPAVEPFFPADADPLERRERQRRAERQAFLTALAAGEGGAVTLHVPEAAAGRGAFPSRWALEVASALEGTPLDATTFLGLREEGRPWLRVLASARQGVRRATRPADLEDRRLGEAAAWGARGRLLRDHPMAARADLPLGPGLAMLEQRRSAEFTAFDGNVSSAAAAAAVRRVFDGRPVAATAVERWATCPFRYFLEHVLAVDPTERPEDAWTINPLERGTLVHDVLEGFFAALLADGRPRVDEPYTDADAALLERLAADAFARVEGRGLTGHPLAWENARGAVLADLRAFLALDQEWRLRERVAPVRVEQAFGSRRPAAWDPVEVAVDGLRLRFRGRIDRIDVDPVGRRAFLFDYKTGSDFGYGPLTDDPVAAGRHVQLALYARAVQANLGHDFTVGGAYWFVSTRADFKRLDLPLDRARVDGRLDEVLALVTEGIRTGAFPQVPGEPDRGSFENCRHCDFDRVCPAGRDDLWQDKRHDPLAGLHGRLQPGSESGPRGGCTGAHRGAALHSGGPQPAAAAPATPILARTR